MFNKIFVLFLDIYQLRNSYFELCEKKMIF